MPELYNIGMIHVLHHLSFGQESPLNFLLISMIKYLGQVEINGVKKPTFTAISSYVVLKMAL